MPSRVSVALAVLVLAGGAGALYVTQLRESTPAAAQQAGTPATPRLRIATAVAGPSERELTLLADVKPWMSTTMYGKLGGYLKTLNVDRGDRVKAGQVIGEMESEETDSQYAAALADFENKRGNAKRDQDMLVHGHVSKQAADNSMTAMRMAEAQVKQLKSLKDYEILRAPFDGTVTMRFVDAGSLISNASTNQSNALPVITVADTTKLRVATYIEQADVPFAPVGTPVIVTDPTNTDRKVEAKISRTAGTLDQKTRTLYVEIDINNGDDFLAAGSFAHVTLHLPLQSYPQIPQAALSARGDKQIVASLDEANQIHYREVTPVAVGAGTALVNIAAGVKVGERVVLYPPEEIAEGTKVEPIVPQR